MKLAKKVLNLFKENLLTIIFTLFLIFLIMFSKSNMQAAKNGLSLWAKNVVPSLLPFFIASELLNYTNLPYYLGKLTNKFMKPLFNVPGEASYIFIMGIISGYPIGAKIVNKFYEDGILTKSEAERILAFSNNSSPLFIIGTVGISLFGYTPIGILLFITHILSCLTVGLIFGFFSKFKYVKNSRYVETSSNSAPYNFSNLGTILSNSITNAISTILLIGGFIILFSLIISILNNTNIINSFSHMISFLGLREEYINGIIAGLLEITNGISSISSINDKIFSTKIIITAFLLGFAGMCIFMQILSIVAKNSLSMKPYIIGKLMQGLFAALYTSIAIHYFSFFNLDLINL